MRFKALSLPIRAAVALLAMVVFPAAAQPPAPPDHPLRLPARSRVNLEGRTNQWMLQETTLEWAPRKTALVICDMWDQHWCAGATRRVGEMASRMNEVIKAARQRGVLIIHCPSGTMNFYENTPQRALARSAPPATPKVPLLGWCHLDRSREAELPIDDSDGGCDDWPGCKTHSPWKRQITTLEIEEGDAITDSAEAYSLIQARGIENVIVMGVHLNMCVLGRPFSIRQMVNQGKNVVLVRDLTDTMYNSRKSPYVPHPVGTDLMVEHVEKYWCPSITSVAFLGGAPFRFQEDQRKKVVFLIGEEEYKTEQTLPAYAQRELEWRGFDLAVVQENSADKNQFPGLVRALSEADLLLVSVRRRALPTNQLEAIRAHLQAGKPLVGIRTASHAFSPRPADTQKGAAWLDFDPTVLGGHYRGHHGHGSKTSLQIAPGAEKHPLLIGVSVEGWLGHGSLYQVNPLTEQANPLLIGSIPGKPPEPIAWTHSFGPNKARIFYTSFGHPDDFAEPSFRRLLLNAIHWAVDRPIPPAAPAKPADRAQAPTEAWQMSAVPGTWEDLSGLQYDGIAWYRCLVRPPASWAGKEVQLTVEQIDNAAELFVNGIKVGVAGSFADETREGVTGSNSFPIASTNVQPGQWNLIAFRVLDRGGRGGFKGRAPFLRQENQAISLEGPWQFRTGDSLHWARRAGEESLGDALYHQVGEVSRLASTAPRTSPASSQPLSPSESATRFTVPPDLEIELVLSEPLITQPLHISFDSRGRLWLVEYRQYPAPAGLKLVSHDEYWRAVYDKVPPPPPNHFPGADRISIHEDTDGDGRYDRHKVFVDGLNITTSCAVGRDGVWVLNPPYLLFYPDRNEDDRPDGPPEVHLEGFGLEDTHAVVNSLRWGPDGWLYAAQGSTVTAKARRPESEPVFSQGQNIWRYHPDTRQYEIFSEGGGNAFGVEMDPQGRIFSGHNGGNTRGFHYVQGAYLQKGFEKHGPLSNPYAFGYFPQMAHHDVERFTHTFLFYHGPAFPSRYQGRLFGVEPLQGRVVMSELEPVASTFKTRDLGYAVTTSDRWFKPVDIKLGPDGALYIADWYDGQVNHWRNYQGNMDASNGRVYRLKAKGSPPQAPFDLRRSSSTQLVRQLSNPNPWWRQTALRLLADRRDDSVATFLRQALDQAGGQESLELLWALNLVRGGGGSRGLTDADARRGLAHPEPAVRLWTVRLLGDERSPSPALAKQLVALAATETNLEVRVQLASTAKRLSAAQGLPLVRALSRQSEDGKDPRVPLLLWWALESKCGSDRDAVLSLLDDSTWWQEPVVQNHLLHRLMRRFAAAGTRRDLLTCARLIELAPDSDARGKLMQGFEEAFQGRSLTGLPEELVTTLAARNLGSPAFKVRRGDSAALELALKTIRDPSADIQQRQQFLEVLGEVRHPSAVPALLETARAPGSNSLRKAALGSLLLYDEAEIGRVLGPILGELTNEVQTAALTLLSSRKSWSLDLVEAVSAGRIPPSKVPAEFVQKMKLHDSPELQKKISELWPEPSPENAAEIEKRIHRWAGVVRSGDGNPYTGQKLFHTACASCHTLFARGGQIGPDLTTYQRTDLDNILLSIVNPNAEIREGYQNFVVETKDDRTLTGFLVEKDEQALVLRGLDGRNVTVPSNEILDLRPATLSLMPEGLLDHFSDQEVRDLFAYLRSTQPLVR